MRRFCLLCLLALSTSGCSLIAGFDNLSFEPEDTGAIDGSLPPDSTIEVDAGPDPMNDAEPVPDAGPDEDAFISDAGPTDTGPTEGDSMPDTSTPDAEVPDAGPDAEVMDAGPEEDASVPDTGPGDAGPTDSGPTDAGPDTFVPDAGPPDTGPPDMGPTDAGPAPCSVDPTQARCLIRIRFVNSPLIQYYWLKRYVRGMDGGPGMTEDWHPCNGGLRLIDATTSECVYQWTPIPGTEVTFVPGYDADTSACNTATCLASPESVFVYDEAFPMGAVTSVIESTPPVGSLPTAAFRLTVPSP